MKGRKFVRAFERFGGMREISAELDLADDKAMAEARCGDGYWTRL